MAFVFSAMGESWPCFFVVVAFIAHEHGCATQALLCVCDTYLLRTDHQQALTISCSCKKEEELDTNLCAGRGTPEQARMQTNSVQRTNVVLMSD